MFTLPGFIVYTQTCTHKTDLHEQQLRYATPSSYTTIKNDVQNYSRSRNAGSVFASGRYASADQAV